MGFLDNEIRLGFHEESGILHAEYKKKRGEPYATIVLSKDGRCGALEALAFDMHEKMGVGFEISDVFKIGSMGSRYYDLSIEEKFHFVTSSIKVLLDA